MKSRLTKASITVFVASVKHNRGDIHPETGLIYWDTWRGKERWRSAEVVARWRANMMRHVKKWQQADPALGC